MFRFLVSAVFFGSGGVFGYGDDLAPVDFSGADAAPCDVAFAYYNESGAAAALLLNPSDDAAAALDRRRPTKILVGDYEAALAAPWIGRVRDAFLRGGGAVLVVDWAAAGGGDYGRAADNVRFVGETAGRFVAEGRLDPASVQVVGFGLGAHVAAHIGKFYLAETNNRLSRITALDPAGPKFENADVTDDDRLSRNDAGLVDVYHTNAQRWGYAAPIGHVDFYPNNGNYQPGCGGDDIDSCSHRRAPTLFAESIESAALAYEVAVDVVATPSGGGGLVLTRKLPFFGRIATFGQMTFQFGEGSFSLRTESSPPFLNPWTSLL